MRIIIYCIIILLTVFIPIGTHGPPITHAGFIQEEDIKAECNKYKNANLLKAIIKVESNFNPNVVSKKGCIGLMQVHPKFWTKELKEVGIINNTKDLFKPKKNIEAGNYILSKYRQKSSLQKALTKYSGGEKNYYKKVFKELHKINKGE